MDGPGCGVRRGDELEAVSGADELPTAVVDPVVVVAAQADQVVRLVAAAVGPVHQVVDLDPDTTRSTWFVVPFTANSTSISSVSAAAMRVIARTFE